MSHISFLDTKSRLGDLPADSGTVGCRCVASGNDVAPDLSAEVPTAASTDIEQHPSKAQLRPGAEPGRGALGVMNTSLLARPDPRRARLRGVKQLFEQIQRLYRSGWSGMISVCIRGGSNPYDSATSDEASRETQVSARRLKSSSLLATTMHYHNIIIMHSASITAHDRLPTALTLPETQHSTAPPP